jgi:hypothetical protein
MAAIAFYNQVLNFYLENLGELGYNKSMEAKQIPGFLP